MNLADDLAAWFGESRTRLNVFILACAFTIGWVARGAWEQAGYGRPGGV